MSIDHYFIMPIVVCFSCGCEVAQVDDRGWCPGCVRYIDAFMEEYPDDG